MPRTDRLDQSTTRVELEPRAREARIRLDYLERLLAVRPLPRESLLRRLLRRLRLRSYAGRQIADGSDGSTVAGGRARRDRDVAGEAGAIVSDGFTAPPVWRPSCVGATRMSPVRVPAGRHRVGCWNYLCGRGDADPHLLSDKRF